LRQASFAIQPKPKKGLPASLTPHYARA